MVNQSVAVTPSLRRRGRGRGNAKGIDACGPKRRDLDVSLDSETCTSARHVPRSLRAERALYTRPAFCPRSVNRARSPASCTKYQVRARNDGLRRNFRQLYVLRGAMLDWDRPLFRVAEWNDQEHELDAWLRAPARALLGKRCVYFVAIFNCQRRARRLRLRSMYAEPTISKIPTAVRLTQRSRLSA